VFVGGERSWSVGGIAEKTKSDNSLVVGDIEVGGAEVDRLNARGEMCRADCS